MKVKKGLSLAVKSEAPISKAILKLRKDNDLCITIFGAVLLSPFSEKTIKKSQDKLRQLRGKISAISKPFNYFLATCMEIAKYLCEEPNWNKTLELSKFYGVENGMRVTEDDEFLSPAPNLVKKLIDKEAMKSRSQKGGWNSSTPNRGPKFDSTTYTKYGERYLKPVENEEWTDSEAIKRMDKGPEYWINEKREFLELAKQGKVSKKGLVFLVESGLLEQSDIADIDPLKGLECN